MGKTKRKYHGESIKISKNITKALRNIFILLPKNYSKQDILKKYKQYYPYEWQILIERQRVYQEKDEFLARKNKQKRYYPETPESFFFSQQKVKHMLSKGARQKHTRLLNELNIKENKQKIIIKRKNAIKKKDEKIKTAKLNSQNVAPSYLDKLMEAYHKNKLSAEEKLIILDELTRFDNEKITTFFRKINDSEKIIH
ncbi:hypothetical protein [Staphylococcus debuckii]|uniref:Uncharacterized protein n=1 Tax=Staphylococcus debuckii TaxID=2044912 RepID=A0ABU9EV42_9STAP